MLRVEGGVGPGGSLFHVVWLEGVEGAEKGEIEN